MMPRNGAKMAFLEARYSHSTFMRDTRCQLILDIRNNRAHISATLHIHFQRYIHCVYLVVLHANPLSEMRTSYTCIYFSEIQYREGRHHLHSCVMLFTF